MSDTTEIERVDASSADLDAAEETSNSWMHIVKVICIVGKIAIVVLMMVVAIFMYVTKYKKCTMIPVMLFCYILCLIMLIALDMTSKYIAGFFLLIYMSNYFNFLGFYKILDNLPGAPGVALRQKTLWYFRLMNVLYVLTLGLAFVPRFGPYCTAEKVYPACMNWTACLFIANFIFHLVINCNKDFFLSEGPIVQQNENDDDFAPLQEEEKEKDDGNDESKSSQDWVGAADSLHKKMFRSQMTIYLWFQVVLVVCNIAIQFWGRIFVHKNHFLGCTDGGNQWLYTTIEGELFVGAHMVLIITQAVMLEQALYKVPKKLGWFNQTDQSICLAADEYPEAKVTETSNAGDNDYKTIN